VHVMCVLDGRTRDLNVYESVCVCVPKCAYCEKEALASKGTKTKANMVTRPLVLWLWQPGLLANVEIAE
jgi:hypothetical protein